MKGKLKASKPWSARTSGLGKSVCAQSVPAKLFKTAPKLATRAKC